MNLAVIGTGYVGLVSGTCFADMGNHVICVDSDQRKLGMLNNNQMPIYEPGLKELVERNAREGRLTFSSSLEQAVQNSDVVFIAVGTPPGEDGSADLSYVLAVAKDIARYMNHYLIIVDKSTVPVGTADKVRTLIKSELASRGADIPFSVVSNPEFLKEGAAIDDFMKPDRVVLGVDEPEAGRIMRELYLPFNRTSERIILMSVRSAEMTKYAANAMLATKISFMNELSRLCEALGADISEVRHGIGSDSRIGYKFIYPGVGYGGSCFPKDVQALIQMHRQAGTQPRILTAVEAVNQEQKLLLVDKIKQHFGNDLSGIVFAVWGLAFKPQTDDMREASSVVIIRALLEAGAKVQAYDPVAIPEARHLFGEQPGLAFPGDEYEVLKNADALLLITEWHQFRYPDLQRVKNTLKQAIFFDGRNQFDPQQMRAQGFSYYSIGRQ